MTPRGRAALVRHFRWHAGHADVWNVFADGEALRAVVDDLVAALSRPSGGSAGWRYEARGEVVRASTWPGGVERGGGVGRR